MKKLLAPLLLLIALPAQAAIGPEELIKETSAQVLAGVKANPDNVHSLVNELVAPHVDFETMTNMALGKHKDKVLGEQKRELVKQFRALLIRTYSSALVEYSGEELKYLPMTGDVETGFVKVKSEVEQQGGFPIPIDYSLQLQSTGWKVINISVDEVSLVTNYRSSFARAIKRKGVDGLIKSLQEQNEEMQ